MATVVSRWARIFAAGLVAAVVVAVVVAVAVVGSGTWVVGRRAAVPRDVVHLPEAGVALRLPDGWVERRDAARHPSVVVEFEDRAPFGLLPMRGMWVSRRRPSADDPPARVVDAVPSTWGTLRRTRHIRVANGQIYEIGFWGPVWPRDDETERGVLTTVRFFDPASRTLNGEGFSLRVPGTWNGPDEAGGCFGAVVCVFSPDRVPAAWLYVFDRRAPSPTRARDDLVDDLEAGGAIDLRVEEAVVSARPSHRFRFEYREPAPPPGAPTMSSIEELLVPVGGERFVLVALGWRSFDGRAALDDILGTLRVGPGRGLVSSP